MTEGERVQQESAADAEQMTPSPPGSTSKSHTRVVSWQCGAPGCGTQRKQVPSASLFPQKCQEKQNLQNGGKGLIHGSIKCINGRKEVQGGERQKEGNLMEKLIRKRLFFGFSCKYIFP